MCDVTRCYAAPYQAACGDEMMVCLSLAGEEWLINRLEIKCVVETLTIQRIEQFARVNVSGREYSDALLLRK